MRIAVPTLTPWQKHVARWKNCTACELHEGRRNVVLGKGSWPAEVVFVGEAPGTSENVAGLPFHGPAGKLLDEIVAAAVVGMTRVPSMAYSNLVCCIPRYKLSAEVGKPERDHILACRDRLVDFVRTFRPKLVVLVGTLAAQYVSGQSMFDPVDWLDEGTLEFVEIAHPGSMLPGRNGEGFGKMTEAKSGLLRQQAEVRLRSAMRFLDA